MTEREVAVQAGISTWFEQHYEREGARQRSQIETAKLIVTFALAVAATLVATALQVDPRGTLDVIAVVILGLAFLAALGTIMADRTASADPTAIETEGTRLGWDSTQLLAAYRAAHRQAEQWNTRVVTWVHRSTLLAVLLILASAALAAVSLVTK